MRAFLFLTTLVLLSACTAGERSPDSAGKSRQGPVVSTAREAYPLAEKVARRWKSDAELRSVRTTLPNPMPAQLREGMASWAFYFISPSSRIGDRLAGYIVSVSEGEAVGVKEEKFALTSSPLFFVDWKVDSPQALRVFLDNGGQDFLVSHAEADVHVVLRPSEGSLPPVWDVVALDKQTKSTLALVVNASTGAVVRRS